MKVKPVDSNPRENNTQRTVLNTDEIVAREPHRAVTVTAAVDVWLGCAASNTGETL